MSKWILLRLVILFEIAGSTSMQFSRGFTKLYQAFLIALPCLLSCFLLSTNNKSKPFRRFLNHLDRYWPSYCFCPYPIFVRKSLPCQIITHAATDSCCSWVKPFSTQRMKPANQYQGHAFISLLSNTQPFPKALESILFRMADLPPLL